MPPPYREVRLIPNDPLSLPEIQLLIAQYLHDCDLIQCILVNKLWYTAFLPCLWEELTLKYTFIDNQPIGPLLNSLHRNRTLVKILNMKSAFSTNYAIQYPRLHTLRLRMVDVHDDGPTPTIDLEQEYDPTPLVALNSFSLETLSLSYFKGTYTRAFWRVASDIKTLRTLELQHSTVDNDEAMDFYQTFCQLTSLSLVDCSIGRGNLAANSNMIFRNLQQLQLERIDDLDGGGQLDIIRRCPVLESLCWRPRNRVMTHTSGHFIRELDMERWPLLSKLSLTSPISDIDLSMIFSKMKTTATELKLDMTLFGKTAFESLKLRHLSTITELNLTNSGATNPMNLHILSSCPLLTSFESTIINLSELHRAEQWVCLSIKKLYVHFGSSPRTTQSTTVQEEAFNRLSKLVHLQDLNVATRENNNRRSALTFTGLKFKIECGVGALSSLRKLRRIAWNFYQHNMGMEDIDWIIGNWKALERITGQLNSNESVGNVLHEKLKTHGIIVQTTSTPIPSTPSTTLPVVAPVAILPQ